MCLVLRGLQLYTEIYGKIKEKKNRVIFYILIKNTYSRKHTIYSFRLRRIL